MSLCVCILIAMLCQLVLLQWHVDILETDVFPVLSVAKRSLQLLNLVSKMFKLMWDHRPIPQKENGNSLT